MAKVEVFVVVVLGADIKRMSAIRIEHSELTNAEVTLPNKTINDSVAEWTPAYFNPPLAAERNGWVLNQLRRFSIRTVSPFPFRAHAPAICPSV